MKTKFEYEDEKSTITLSDLTNEEYDHLRILLFTLAGAGPTLRRLRKDEIPLEPTFKQKD